MLNATPSAIDFWPKFQDDEFTLDAPTRRVLDVKEGDIVSCSFASNKPAHLAICNDVMLLCTLAEGKFTLLTRPINRDQVAVRAILGSSGQCVVTLITPNDTIVFDAKTDKAKRELVAALHQEGELTASPPIANLAMLYKVYDPTTVPGTEQLTIEYKSIPGVSRSLCLDLFLVPDSPVRSISLSNLFLPHL